MRLNISGVIAIQFAVFIVIGLFSSDSRGSRYYVGLNAGVKFALDESYIEHDLMSFSKDVFFGGEISDKVDLNFSYQSPESIKRRDNKVVVETESVNLTTNYKFFEDELYTIYSGVGLSYWNVEKEDYITGKIVDRGFSPTLSLAFDYEIIDDLKFEFLYRYTYGVGGGNTGQYDGNGFYIGFKYYLENQGEGGYLHDNKEDARVGFLEKDTIEKSNDNFEVILPFEINSSLLRPLVKVQLIDTYKYIIDNNVSKVFIAGHTDDTGSETYNEKLSLERAKNVRDYLHDLGVPLEFLSLYAKGSREPHYSNQDPKGREKNRRVVITFK